MGLLAAVWFGSGEDVPQGYARQLDGCGGMLSAWAWRLHKTYKTYKTYKMMMGRQWIPRGFAVPLGGGVRGGRFTAGVKPINPTDNKPTNPKTNSAARLEESAAAPTGQSVRDF